MVKKTIKIIGFLALGLAGGFLYQAFLFPYLAGNPYFDKFKFIKEFKERQVTIYPKEVVVVRENDALTGSVEKVGKTVVGVKASKKGSLTIEGSGIVLTSDGLAVFLNNLLPEGYALNFYLDNELVKSQILKRDLKKNLVLVKIDKNNLQTAGFADLGGIKLGDRVFLVGAVFEKSILIKEANDGIIKVFDDKLIKTSIIENTKLNGSPLFDIEGNLLGLNIVDKDNRVSAISVKEIRGFAGL